jgi:hypothetical integral membrane protein (TIGR02206 family)
MPESPPALHVFQAGSQSHFVALALTLLGAFVMLQLAWRGRTRTAHKFELVLATILAVQWPANVLVSWQLGTLSLANGLPCHLCDLASLLGAHALLTRHRLSSELLYFWGIAGTMQGLITPALSVDWPHPAFVSFFALHGGVVVAASYVVFGLKLVPRTGAVARAMAWLVVYGVVAGIVDFAAASHGANYGFLRVKPHTASLLDHMGEWPWYLGSLALFALLIFTVLDLPFAMQRRRHPVT